SHSSAPLPAVARQEEEPRRPPTAEFPVAFNQQEMWVQCQLYPGTGINNICVDVRLSGPLDVPRFQRALQAIVDRHAALRASFPATDGPMQLISPPRPVRCPVEDLSGCESDEADRRLRQRAEAI